MTIGEVSSAGVSSAATVKLFKQQSKQEEEIVNTLIKSATETAPAPGKGARVNVVA